MLNGNVNKQHTATVSDKYQVSSPIVKCKTIKTISHTMHIADKTQRAILTAFLILSFFCILNFSVDYGVADFAVNFIAVERGILAF